MRLIETTIASTASTPPQVDADAGIIRGVKVLGKVSANGRTYSPKAMESAAKMYAGVSVNIDHPSRSSPDFDRSIRDGFGRLTNPRTAADGVYADLEYLKAHPLAAQVVEAATRMPDQLGLSHNAEGDIQRSKDGTKTVVDVTAVYSVDLVRYPATNASLFESRNQKGAKMLLSDLWESIIGKLSGTAAKKAEKVGKLLEDYMDAPMDAAITPPEDANAETSMDAVFSQAVMEILTDKSLDQSQKVKKIKDLLSAYETVTAPAEPPADSTSTDSKTTDSTVESLRREIAAMRTESACRSLLEANRIPCDPVKLKALAAIPEADRPTLIESWSNGAQSNDRDRDRPARPTFSRPLREADSRGDQYPATSKEFAEFLK